MKFRAHDLKRVTPEGKILEQTSENTKSPDLAPRFQDFDLLADAVVVFNASSGRVAHINAAARTLTTQSAAKNQSLTTLQDWTGKSPDFFRPGGHADTFEPQACFRLETLLADCLFEVHVKLHQAADQQDYLTAVFRDIAERSESERMTKELVSTISHELRSPMTAIKGAMGLIVSGAAGELSDKAREMVLIAQRNADRLVLIINDFLDLEKFSDGQMVFDDTPSDLLPVVYDAVEAIAGFQGRFDVTVEIDAQDSDLRSLLGSEPACASPRQPIIQCNQILTSWRRSDNPPCASSVIQPHKRNRPRRRNSRRGSKSPVWQICPDRSKEPRGHRRHRFRIEHCQSHT
nr:HAMP domain-containing sensor histidine kinase [Sulfitobacter sp. S223]